MADNTLSTAASVLFEMQGKMQELYPKDYVMLAELSGVGSDNDDVEGRVTPDLQPASFFNTYAGLRVRVPIQPHGLQGAQGISETGTVNVPIPLAFSEAHITLSRQIAPTSITLDLEEDSMDNSAITMVAQLLKSQRLALAELVNDMLNGNGDANLGLADTTQATAGGLTLTVAAGTDFDKLYPGKVVDVATASSGADPGQGLRRLIASTNETASPPTVTFSTTQQASDGGSGNISLSNAVGIYITGTYTTAGNQAMQGIEQAAAITGTFENIDKAANSYWQGTDGRQGTTTTVPLSDTLLDSGVLLGQRAAVGHWDFGIGDPRAINVYKNGKSALLRYAAPVATLRSGFKGIIYDGLDQELPLVAERKHKSGALKLIRRDRMTLYGRKKGPALEDSTGSAWMRYSRALPKESWYVDRLNLGVHDCASIVFFNNLSTS